MIALQRPDSLRYLLKFIFHMQWLEQHQSMYIVHDHTSNCFSVGYVFARCPLPAVPWLRQRQMACYLCCCVSPRSTLCCYVYVYVTHLIEMSCMSANLIFGKTAKCDQKSYFAHFQTLMGMGSEICL